MSKSGFGGFGYGFGKPRASLRKVFESSFGGGKPKLNPEQEKLVKTYAHAILKETDPETSPEHDREKLEAVSEILRELLHASEKAEGEDPSEIDQ